MRKKDEAEEQELQEWYKLIGEAENGSPSKDSGEEVVIEITVAEVLGIGHGWMKPPEVTVVRDTEGKVWLLEETRTDDAELRGLVSRYNVRQGMKFRLRIKKIVHLETRVFPLAREEAIIL